MPICRLASATAISFTHWAPLSIPLVLSLNPPVLLLLWPTFVVVLLFICFCSLVACDPKNTKRMQWNNWNDGQRQPENIGQLKKSTNRKKGNRRKWMKKCKKKKNQRKRLIFTRHLLQCNFFWRKSPFVALKFTVQYKLVRNHYIFTIDKIVFLPFIMDKHIFLSS